ncbi:QacE family quaternary ammonium compound efflux SMR transporter [Weissella muntiaci]|uniref:QacE family quaternary ammonium compound efflux SMR transporter n=1 Tax=Weissella muntiaci TaxID=2508881 RepID=A0A6C2C2E0_9LACO|nr:SMR family transporter [Weissella muntiaci]TYC48181.1 QacE family quaternary ammonium compound efflux SMR transporter [Weissella muntiaci]
MAIIRNPWTKILIAIIFEDGWVVGIKHANSLLTWGLTLLALGISFLLFMTASAQLPVGTVYAVFVGLGTGATVITGWLLFGDHLSWSEIFFLLVLLTGVIGLKFITEEQ